MKSSTPASDAIVAAVTGLSPVTITVLMPMARKALKRSLMSGLTISFRWMTPTRLLPSQTASGVPRRCGQCGRPPAGTNGGVASLLMPTRLRIASTAPLRTERPSTSVPETRVCAANGMILASRSFRSGSARPYLLFAKATIDRPSGVSSPRLASRMVFGERLLRHAGDRDEFGRHAVAEGDRAGLVERQRIDVAAAASTARPEVAMTFETDQSIHAGDADRRQQAADRRRDEADEKGDQHRDADQRAGIDRPDPRARRRR